MTDAKSPDQVRPAQQRGLTPWRKGQSGNDARRSVREESAAGVARLCRKHAPDLVMKLFAIAGGKNKPAAVAAIKVLLERGIGKPTDHVPGDEIFGDDNVINDAIKQRMLQAAFADPPNLRALEMVAKMRGLITDDGGEADDDEKKPTTLNFVRMNEVRPGHSPDDDDVDVDGED